MQVSHLSNRSCCLTLFTASRYKPSFFSSLLLSLHFFQALGCFCSPLLHPFPIHTVQTSQIPMLLPPPPSIGISEARSVACMPTSSSDQTCYWPAYRPLLNSPLLGQDPFCQLITIFLPLSYVKWNVLQTRYISSIASFIDSHWFYLPPLTTA